MIERTLKILSRIYLVSAVLLGGTGLLFCIRWDFYDVRELLFFSIIPAAIFLVFYGFSKRFPIRETHGIAIPIGLIVIVIWGAIILWCHLFFSNISDVTNPRKYEHVLTKRWYYSDALISHFPSSIPNDAQNVRFSFRPAFLQGGAHIQLRYSASPEKIDELYERFSVQKTKSYYGGQSGEHMNMEGGMPTTIFYTSGSENFEFPDDYEIMILDRVLTQEERAAGYSWNHGKSHGVAISKESNEIVYWAESW